MEIICNTCNLSDSLKQALVNSAMRVFDDFVEEKEENLVNKYKDDPRYIKACELLKEKSQLSARFEEIRSELDSLFPFTCSWVSTNETKYILNNLSGIIDIRTKLYDKIRYHLEIEASTIDFNPKRLHNELNEIAREAISKVNI